MVILLSKDEIQDEEYKDKLKVGFFIKLAFKNILNHKRNMGIIIFGFTISITMLLSVYYWSGTSENLALNDFLDTQDYQSYVLSSNNPDDIDEIMENLDENALVELYNLAYSTQALFNTDGKDPSYICLPEDEQENQTNPVSVTNSLLVEQETLDRISFLFDVEGDFIVDENNIVISLKQAQELGEIYGREIQVGDTFNLSIAKYYPNPAYGLDTIEDFFPITYQDFTISGIFTIQDGVSIIQSAFDLEWLSDSILFPLAEVTDADLDEMVTRDIPYIFLVKFDKTLLTDGGLDQVVDKMTFFSENLKVDFPAVYIYILSSPITSLQNAYSRASITIVFMLPVIIVGLILTIFMVNMEVESRRGQVDLFRDRGADVGQILFLFIVEFLIVSVIGIALGVLLAYFVAAIIPSFSAGGFSGAIFVKFLANMQMPFGFTLLTSIGFLVILVGYASFKIWWEVALKSRDSVDGDESRKKFQKSIFMSINIGLVVIVIIALIFSLIETIRNVTASNSFNFTSTLSAGYTFILFCILMIFGAQFISHIMNNKVLTKLKGLYRRLIFNDAFFLVNNFKRKDKKLSTMTFALVIVSSVIMFSVISAESVHQNQVIELEFKNGADLRIITYPIDSDFKNNISQFEGVNEVIPIFKTKGAIAYEDYTIYGVDPIIFSRIGNWDKSCFLEGQSFEVLQALDEAEDGVIIGSGLATRLNLTTGDQLPVANLPGGTYFRLFEIKGVINSAPGLGLADGSNIEMLQPNEGFILINEEFVKEELSITLNKLFLASTLPDYDIKDIAEEIESTNSGISVNPDSVNEEFVGSFVESYIPNILSFFTIEWIITAIIGIVLLVMFTDFTISQRTHELAIAMSMGASGRKTTKLVLLEVLIITLSSSLAGIVLGIAFTYSTFFLITPLLTSHNLIPFTIIIPVLQTILFPVIMTLVAIVGIIPTVIKYSRQDIIHALRA